MNPIFLYCILVWVSQLPQYNHARRTRSSLFIKTEDEDVEGNTFIMLEYNYDLTVT